MPASADVFRQSTRTPRLAALAVLAMIIGAPTIWAAEGAGAGSGRNGGLFVLPIEHAWPISDSAAQVFEERLGIALGNGRRVRPLSARDIPEARRPALPANLSTCVTGACLRRLRDATGADRALAVKVVDDNGYTTLFATVFDARTGETAARREWSPRPDEPPLGPGLTSDLARWASGEPSFPRPPALRPIPPQPGLVALELTPGPSQAAPGPALRAGLAARLSEAPEFSVIARDGGATADASHRATITVDAFHVGQRPHHAGHVRRGALSATVVIVQLPGEAVVFAEQGHAEVSADVHDAGDSALTAALVDEVVAQWKDAFDRQRVWTRLQKKGSP